jgi:hypothetical protein
LQHLNYLEFGELRRVAQRTLDQRLIFVNNLAIRRAVEELKVTSDFEQLCRILEAAFGGNDFDAFDLRLLRPPGELAQVRGLQIVTGDKPHLRWKKQGSHFNKEMDPAWSLTLELVASNNHRRGWLTIYRAYGGDLQLDVNLLTSLLPAALADALDRILGQAVAIALPDDGQSLNAQVRAS